MKYKITGILLLCGILLASVACSSEKPVTDNTVTTDTSAVQSEITEEVTTAELPDIPEDTDYSGHNFRVIARGSGKWTCTDMYAEKQPGNG